jgi:hypothetical protein
MDWILKRENNKWIRDLERKSGKESRIKFNLP